MKLDSNMHRDFQIFPRLVVVMISLLMPVICQLTNFQELCFGKGNSSFTLSYILLQAYDSNSSRFLGSEAFLLISLPIFRCLGEKY